MTDVYGPGQEPPTNKPTARPPEPPPSEEERRVAEPAPLHEEERRADEPTPPPATAERKGPSHDEKNWAMACHLSALAGYLTFFGFFVGPLIVWLVKKDEYPLVDDQGKESLNFELSILLYYVISGLLVFVIVGIPLLIAVAVFQLVEIIIASVKAKNGEMFRYPLTIRFVS
ncbi:MAG: DUF4870 domain-containing protein [Myxococcales bacterium]|jgi:uncharacterized Tic20 family protein